MERFIRALTAASTLLILLVANAAPSAETARAIQRLVDSQQLEKNWPLVAQSLAATGPALVMEAATSEFERSNTLNSDEKKREKLIMQELAPEIAAEVTEYLKKTDARKKMTEMVTAVYPRYFSAREIQEMSAYYEGSASKKLLKIDLDARAESRRTGEDEMAIFQRNESQISPQEKQQIADFMNSPLGKKHQALGPHIIADTKAFFENDFAPVRAQIGKKYGMILAQKMKPNTGKK